jgi:hypothetical protein
MPRQNSIVAVSEPTERVKKPDKLQAVAAAVLLVLGPICSWDAVWTLLAI